MDENTPLHRQLLSIPNILSYVRIILIPFIVWKYAVAETLGDYYEAAFIVLLSGLTDFLDGFIARRFNMITPIGKLMDPIADKLTQFALILALSFRFHFMFIMFVVFLVKENFMMLMNVLLFKRDQTLHGAIWCGKICTTALYIIMFILIMVPTISHKIANILIAIGICFLIYAFIGYGKLYAKMWKN